MPAKSASTRAKAKLAPKSVRAAASNPRPKTVRLSKLEAKRLERFKALMQKYTGKCSFDGCDQ